MLLNSWTCFEDCIRLMSRPKAAFPLHKAVSVIECATLAIWSALAHHITLHHSSTWDYQGQLVAYAGMASAWTKRAASLIPETRKGQPHTFKISSPLYNVQFVINMPANKRMATLGKWEGSGNLDFPFHCYILAVLLIRTTASLNRDIHLRSEKYGWISHIYNQGICELTLIAFGQRYLYPQKSCQNDINPALLGAYQENKVCWYLPLVIGEPNCQCRKISRTESSFPASVYS